MTDETAGDSTNRFSARAGEYDRHRPDYPDEVLDYLETRDYLDLGTKVAEIGAGTGIFTEQLIGRGCEVWAVEPNAAMRGIAETNLGTRNMFHSVPAEAEDTRIDDETVDLVVAAQAFHWFDLEAAREEFERILQPPGRVALLWNLRDRDGSEFMEELESLIETYAEEYDEVVGTYESQTERLEEFFGGAEAEGTYEHRSFEHSQQVGKHGLMGLVTSFSYMPRPNAEDFGDLMGELQDLFDRHAEAGSVEILYDTELYFGTLGL